ncbi:MAG TPA: glycerol kinase GlpK [Polyangiaceae bacterium]|jgi:glycerol kinase
MAKHLLAIDQGTTGSTALVVARDGTTLGRGTVEFPQHFPQPGWVEHDAGEIWKSVETSIGKALEAAHVSASDIGGIGITNQRETTLVWDKKTGAPIHRAIVWQCRRTAAACDELKRAGHAKKIFERTGLVIDAYFSGTKIAWLLDNVSGARARAEKGELAFGTIDSFLIHRLTGGQKHLTDVTNASRTLLFGLSSLAWDDEMLALFRVPRSMLPDVVSSAEIVGETRGLSFLPDGIPIAGIAGDQQAALFGQACFRPGEAKCTYGTGAFALMNVGDKPVWSKSGLVTTVAWRIGKDPAAYALEGSSFIAGAAVQWLRDGLGLIKTAAEIEGLAREVASSDGVVFVPALAGLGAPYWDQGARGAIVGLTRGTTRAHLARATLEGIAFSVYDLLEAMAKDAGHELTQLRVDGGAARNDLLMQFQAGVAKARIERPFDVESTGRGAAMLAAVGLGWLAPNEAQSLLKIERSFEPDMSDADRSAHLGRWRDAIRRTRTS